MFDDFLPIPDAESLPFYPLVFKLVVCVRTTTELFAALGGDGEAHVGRPRGVRAQPPAVDSDEAEQGVREGEPVYAWRDLRAGGFVLERGCCVRRDVGAAGVHRRRCGRRAPR